MSRAWWRANLRRAMGVTMIPSLQDDDEDSDFDDAEDDDGDDEDDEDEDEGDAPGWSD